MSASEKLYIAMSRLCSASAIMSATRALWLEAIGWGENTTSTLRASDPGSGR